MISSLSILLPFWVILAGQHRRQIFKDSTTKVIIAFIGSLSIQSILYFGILALPLDGLRHLKALLFLIWILWAGLAIVNSKYSRAAIDSLTHFSCWSLISEGRRICTTRVDYEQEKSTLYRLAFTAICAMVIAANIFNPSPVNWDSNSYNVARVASMLAHSSPFLEKVSVAKQAILPVAHDILFFPDLLFGNTRGLGLICGLEFIAILCICAQISLQHISIVKACRTAPSDFNSYSSLLLCLSLLIGSDLQSMQSVVTKNDLIITLTFVCAVYFSCKFLSKTLGISAFFILLLFVVSYSTSCKSYGIISAFPFVISFFIEGVNKAKKTSTWDLYTKQKKYFSLKAAFRATRGYLMQPRKAYLGPLLVLIAIGQMASDYSVRLFANKHHIIEVKRLSEAWTNYGNNLVDSLAIFLVNLARNSTSILLYPLTSMRFVGTRISHQLNHAPLFKFLNVDFGKAEGTSFEWPVYNEGTAHTSVFVLLAIASGFLAWRTLYCYYKEYRLPNGKILTHQLGKMLLMTLASSTLAYFTITFTVLYQPWIGRFLGPAYVPLIPIVSFLLGQLAYIKVKSPKFTRILKILLTCFLVVSLVMQCRHIMYTSLVSDWKLTFSSEMQPIPTSERPYVNHISRITDSDPSAFKDIVNHLRDGPFRKRVICTTDNSWTMTPTILSLKNKSFHGNNLENMLSSECLKSLTKTIKDDMEHLDRDGKKVFIASENNTEYIFLP